jgi:hypothetical protein
MKKYFDLTKSQQEEAVEYALNELRAAIAEGFIDFGRTLPDSLLLDYATSAAETAFYSEVEDKIIADIA